MRQIDADKLMLSLNDTYLANCPIGNETLNLKDYKESICEGLEMAMKTVEEAPTVNGWISVKDRLPESSGIKVIVSAKTIPESVLQTKAVFVAFLGYGDGKWYTPDVDFMASAKIGNDNVHTVWEITHWMFLPEPPKEKNDEHND